MSANQIRVSSTPSTENEIISAAVFENDADQSESDVGDDDEEDNYCDPPQGYVRLRPSCADPFLPPTIFFEYPPEIQLVRDDISTLELLGNRKLRYSSHWERCCIRNAFTRAGFTKSNKNWTALWSKHQSAAQLNGLHCLQKVNHFPSSWCIGRKDRLAATLNTMKRIHGKEFDFHPETFIMPRDKDSFFRIVQVESQHSGNHTKKKRSSSSGESLWIIKPCASSCGRGISVATSSQAISIAEKKKVLIQRYLYNPYLINKKKFDLRIYVLVAGVDPLRVYIHEEGLTRISTSDYALSNIRNRFAHLTNYSVNKKAGNFKAADYVNSVENEGEQADKGGDGVAPAPASAEIEGFKWSLAAFRKWLTAKVGKKKMEETFHRIYDLCLKTMIAAEGEITPQLQRSVQYRTNCFELFGCDVILDSNLMPHLLEVNVSPSLMGSSPLDRRIKGRVIADAMHTIGFYPHDHQLIRKYSYPSDESSGPSANSASTGAGESKGLSNNPFAFSNLGKLMNCQDSYRKNPCPATVDLSALNRGSELLGASMGGDGASCSWWQTLLLVEDEMARAYSGGFQLVHPLPSSAAHYTSLFRNPRFADHLLARWLELGGAKGLAGKHLPPPVRACVRGSSTGKSQRSSGLAFSPIKETLPESELAQTSDKTIKQRSKSASRPRSERGVVDERSRMNKSQPNVKALDWTDVIRSTHFVEAVSSLGLDKDKDSLGPPAVRELPEKSLEAAIEERIARNSGAAFQSSRSLSPRVHMKSALSSSAAAASAAASAAAQHTPVRPGSRQQSDQERTVSASAGKAPLSLPIPPMKSPNVVTKKSYISSDGGSAGAPVNAIAAAVSSRLGLTPTPPLLTLPSITTFPPPRSQNSARGIYSNLHGDDDIKLSARRKSSSKASSAAQDSNSGSKNGRSAGHASPVAGTPTNKEKFIYRQASSG